METIKTNGDYKIEFNGKSTYMVTNQFGDVLCRMDTLRKAENKLNKL